MNSLIGLAVALGLVVIVPGPNVLAVTTSSMLDRRRGIRSALGVSTGDMIWATAALVGIGALLANARPVFEAVRIAGVVYLLWFAVRLWRTRSGSETDTATASSRRRS